MELESAAFWTILISEKKEKEKTVGKLTYPMLKHCLTILHLIVGNVCIKYNK